MHTLNPFPKDVQLAVHSSNVPASPKGNKTNILLTSVFGPYAVDDEYGSRKMNPMELYHNQVTREQGPFSLRMFHRSWGLMFIQSNISAPCTMLDFPTRDRFIQELQNIQYDTIGISAIAPNVGKVREMCRLIRKYQPNAVIIVGGHIANAADIMTTVDCDYISRGEGVSWWRRYVGDDANAPLRHPRILSGIGGRNVGCQIDEKDMSRSAATVIPSVGCPMGCNFCATSAMFGGKGNFVNFFPTGEELYHIMEELESSMGVQSFFIMDENFLLYKKRAMELLDLMEKNNKVWAFYVFSSANALRQYTMDQIARLGISWVWMGLEGKESQYVKLHGTDVHQLVRQLQDNGVRIMGSSIIGLETHSPDNIDEVIDYSVSYATDFHQFMLYTPVPGTPLHRELTELGKMKSDTECDPADTHGQFKFNYRHPSIPDGDETEMLREAFARDFRVNGPSTVRVVETTLKGWMKNRNHPSARVRARYEWEMRPMRDAYIPLLAATVREYKKSNPKVAQWAQSVLNQLYKIYGLRGRIMGWIGGMYVSYTMHREARLLKNGWTYEPPTFYERNAWVDRQDIPQIGIVEPLVTAEISQHGPLVEMDAELPVVA